MNLPTDIISEILIPFLPRFTGPPTRHSDPFAAWKGSYFIALHQLTQWRFVCRAWYFAITPLLYRDIIIHCTPIDPLSRRLKFAQFNPHLVRQLVVRVAGIPTGLSLGDARREIFEAIEMCEGLLKLEFYDLPAIFTGTGTWEVEECFQNIIPPTLTSLVFRSSSLTFDAGSGLPHTINVMTSMLRGIGPSLAHITDLQLLDLSSTDWAYQMPSLPIHLPSLERLVLHGFNLDFMANLLSVTSSSQAHPILDGIPEYRNTPSQVSNPLRDLTISRISDYNFSIPSLYTLFEINHLGRHLTSLRIQKLHMHNFLVDPEIPITLLRLCPSLEQFFFVTQTTESWIDLVPSDYGGFVNTLGMVPHSSYKASTERFTQVIRMLPNIWGRELKRLHLNLTADYAGGSLSKAQLDAVGKACQDVGLELMVDTYSIS